MGILIKSLMSKRRYKMKQGKQMDGNLYMVFVFLIENKF